MAKRLRYSLTGAGIIAGLILTVTVTRSIRKLDLAAASESAKTKGPSNAPIHLVVYSDFQCPACAFARKPLEELWSQFSGVMKLEFRHYPLETNHRWAMDAARFAECAGEQGRFWEFHDRLYGEQKNWSVSSEPRALFSKYVQEFGFDEGAFERCVNDPKTIERIRKDQASAKSRQVMSTPTFFINDHMLVGGQQLQEKGKAVIEEELKKAGT